MSTINYHSLSIVENLTHLKTDVNGLSSKESAARLDKYGYNKLSESKSFSAIALFLNQLKNPLIYILIIALVISLATKHFVDAWIILAVVLISVVVGFLQEYKANEALSRLKQMVKYKAKVLRDGREMIVSQEYVVPGDIILLSPGDKVPADARLIEVHDLEVIEATLTGESMPINKNTDTLPQGITMADRINMIYLGTVISKGKAKAVVTATGSQTEIGHISTLVKETKEGETPLQKQLTYFGKTIGIILVILNIFIFVLGILTGKPLFEMFMTSVAVVVAAIPEGLLPAMTVILAIGMQRLAKQNGLVRKMLAVETLGSVSVICSDKTGTLTQGEMRVVEIITETTKLSHNGDKFSETIKPDGEASHIIALKIGLICNNAIIENPEDELHKWTIVGNPTEKALLLAGRAAGLKKEKLEDEEPRIAEIPFDSEYKFMATRHNIKALHGNKYSVYAKGAPERLLPLISFVDVEGKKETLTEMRKREIQKQYEDLTSTGLRVIAVAYKLEENDTIFTRENLHDLVFVGLVALKDPLRPGAKETIELCQEAGIRPIIITGDHKLTATAIAQELGLNVASKNSAEGTDIDNLSDEQLQQLVRTATVFARVEPKHKIRIVTALQANGDVVAMTGDGVNDAPALKKADIGVAVGSGTDVAKETADLVLLDDNFKTIVEAIRRGRGTFDNIRKVILYLLSNSFTEVILISFAIVLGMPLPLLPVQILWIKMIEDSLPSMALAFEPVNDSVMSRPPRGSSETILNSNLKCLLALFVAVSDITLFVIFYYYWKTSGNIELAQTIAFAGLGIASRFYIFSIRGLTEPIYTYNPFKNSLVNISTVFGFLMIAVAIYVPFFNNILHTVPLGVKEWFVLVAYASLSIIVYEMGKRFFIARVA
jgi:P-type Ca2+ transporter type 2C